MAGGMTSRTMTYPRMPNSRSSGSDNFNIGLLLPSAYNAQFSGCAEASHARRRPTMAAPRLRRAHDDISRSAATVGYAPEHSMRQTVLHIPYILVATPK